jgi:hypothetical protein
MEREIITWLAGPLAEARYLCGRSPKGMLCGNTQDFDRVEEYLAALQPHRDTFKIDMYKWMLHDETRRMLRERRTWGALKELAVLLISQGSVSGQDAESLFRRWLVPQISKKALIYGVPWAAPASMSPLYRRLK